MVIGISRCTNCVEFYVEASRKSPILKYAVYMLIIIFVLPAFCLKVFIVDFSLSVVLFFVLHKYATKKNNPKERLTLKQ